MIKKKSAKGESTHGEVVSFTIPWNTTSPSSPDTESAKEEEAKIIDRFVGKEIVTHIPFHKTVCHCGRTWNCYCDALNGESRHSLNYCKGCMVLG